MLFTKARMAIGIPIAISIDKTIAVSTAPNLHASITLFFILFLFLNIAISSLPIIVRLMAGVERIELSSIG